LRNSKLLIVKLMFVVHALIIYGMCKTLFTAFDIGTTDLDLVVLLVKGCNYLPHWA